MSNQTLLWASFVISWLSIAFLKKEDLRRFMPVALFSALLTTVVMEFGISMNWWQQTETVFPFINMSIFTYGAYLVGTIWIFKYTYERFWLFMVTNAVIDFILIYFITSWLAQLGIYQLYLSAFYRYLMSVIMAALLYSYQIWQEGEVSFRSFPSIQLAASKPLDEDRLNKPDKQ